MASEAQHNIEMNDQTETEESSPKNCSCPQEQCLHQQTIQGISDKKM